MPDAPEIFDFNLLMRRKERAIPYYTQDGFFHIAIMKDLFDRLAFLQKEFPSILLINCPPFIWKESGGSAFAEEKKVKTLHHISYLPAPCFEGTEYQYMTSEEITPLITQKYDLILAPLTLHHMNDLPGMMKQIFLSLTEDGVFMANLIGENILQIFHQYMIQTELDLTQRAVHRIHPAVDVKMVGDLLMRAGFTLPVADVMHFPLAYHDILDLIKDIRAMGETALFKTKRPPLTRSVFLNILSQLHTLQNDDGRYHFDVDIVTMMGRAPSDQQQKPMKPGSAEKSLTELL